MGAKPQTDDTAARTVAVLGGGLAGLAASQRLLSAGYDVTLVEKRPFLGGRAFSFYDPQSGVRGRQRPAYLHGMLHLLHAVPRLYRDPRPHGASRPAQGRGVPGRNARSALQHPMARTAAPGPFVRPLPTPEPGRQAEGGIRSDGGQVDRPLPSSGTCWTPRPSTIG